MGHKCRNISQASFDPGAKGQNTVGLKVAVLFRGHHNLTSNSASQLSPQSITSAFSAAANTCPNVASPSLLLITYDFKTEPD